MKMKNRFSLKKIRTKILKKEENAAIFFEKTFI